ncbi:MAG TPA: OB-fold nucleic acid binding domain-containing protein, partial [Bacillota bacterium]|nr:OB-fold nucleic acid binding domain-containing protein [Bacillota bacterium]
MKTGINQYKVGSSFEGFLLVKNVSKGTTSNGKPFLTLILVDKTGEIEAKIWDATLEDETMFVPEKIVKITGRITEFRGMRQLTIQAIRPQQQTDGVNVQDFIQTAPIPKEQLMEKINETIFEIQNPNIQRIVRAFVEKYREELLTYPAAVSNHHEYVSGLAHHIVGMLELARNIQELYPQLNKDLLYAGVILHDLGKIKELSGLVTTTYTLKGQLLG